MPLTANRPITEKAPAPCSPQPVRIPPYKAQITLDPPTLPTDTALTIPAPLDSKQIPMPYIHVFESHQNSIIGKIQEVASPCSPEGSLTHRVKPRELGYRRVVSKSNRHRILNNTKSKSGYRSHESSKLNLMKNMYL